MGIFTVNRDVFNCTFAIDNSEYILFPNNSLILIGVKAIDVKSKLECAVLWPCLKYTKINRRAPALELFSATPQPP